MDGHDGGVELVGTELFAAEGGLQDGEGGGDFVAVPEGAILLVEGDEVALGVEAGIAAGVGEEEEGVETVDFGLVGKQVRIRVERRMASWARSVRRRRGPSVAE